MKRVTSRTSWTAAVILLLAACGCTGQVHNPNGPKAPAAAVSPRHRWRATGDLRSPGAAIDGTINTAAVSGVSYPGAALTIDLGEMCLLNTVVIDQGADPKNFPREVTVLTSEDGKIFLRRWEGPGTRRITNAVLFTPILARYVRLQATVPSDRPWSIAEVYLQ